jgi:hypothetical protein
LDSSSSFPSLTSYFTLLKTRNKVEYSRGLLLDLHKLLLMLLAVVVGFQFDVGMMG